VYCLDADTGAYIWSYIIGESVYSSPAVADGKVYIGSYNKNVYAFKDLPTAPNISGPSMGKPGVKYCWEFHSNNSNGNLIYYYINWGDGTFTETDCVPPCTPIEACHTYTDSGTFTIKAKAVECPPGTLESEWTEFEVRMPRDKAIQNIMFQRFLEHFPILHWLFQRLI
jgi:hypothetical protein